MPCAVWLPMASQFPEMRCHTPNCEFMTANSCRAFLGNLRHTHSGIIQAFLEPNGVSNFMVRTVEFADQSSLSVRTNRALLRSNRASLFDRCATYEGWEGLSSSSSTYRSHREPNMEELILAAGESLNRRIEQERVRQMLSMGAHQYIALHFKVGKCHTLHFMFASIVSEKEVILQTRPRLLMGDPCMTQDLPGAALLQGGTARKAVPYKVPLSHRGGKFPQELEERVAQEGGSPKAADDWNNSGLPPISPRPEGRTRRRPMSERRHKATDQVNILPRMHCAMPEVPDVPYAAVPVLHNLEEAGRYEYTPPFISLDFNVKRPLVMPHSAREPRVSSPRMGSPQMPLNEAYRGRGGGMAGLVRAAQPYNQKRHVGPGCTQ